MSNQNEIYDIKINEEKIKGTESVVYLGQKISCTNSQAEEVDHRITLAWKKFWSLKVILKGAFSLKAKSDIFNACVLPTLTYGSETWTLTKKIIQKIRTTQNSMECSILKIKKKDHVKISNIKSRLIVKQIKNKKWSWRGGVYQD